MTTQTLHLLQPWIDLFKDVYTNGSLCAPRNEKILEIENYTATFQPRQRFCSFKNRKFNLNYIKREIEWYYNGDLSDTSIIEHAKIWGGLVSEDGLLQSNYGHYAYQDGGLTWVFQELSRDRDSRRAFIPILNKSHLNERAKDVPCTMGLGFRIRNGYLNTTASMRSSDMIFGMTNDVPTFYSIAEILLATLNASGMNLKLGTLTVQTHSMHVYERHFKMVESILENPVINRIKEPPAISGLDEVSLLLYGEGDVKDNYKYTQWLRAKK